MGSLNGTGVSARPGIFYGYWVAIAGAVIATVQSGAAMYSFSLFVLPLQSDMGWNRGEIMLAFTSHYVFMAATSPFAGKLVDRHEARRIIVIGATIAGAAFVLLSRVNSVWQFCAGYGMLGVGIAAMGYVPSSAVVSNWFKKRRGMALGIMSVGLGAGGIALAPLIGGKLIPDFGWRTAYIFLAIIVWAVVIPLALFVMRTRPSDMGLFPDGAPAPEPVLAGTSRHVGISLKTALGTFVFWMLVATFFTSNFAEGGLIQSQAPHLQDIGFPVATAAGALGVMGLTSAVGKVIFGWLCDRITPKRACLIGLLLQAGGLAIFMTIKAGSPVSIVWLYAFLWGLGIGSWLPTMSMLTSSTFGMASYGAIFGVMAFAQGIGVSLGPLLGGHIYDANQDYFLAFVIFLLMYAVSIPTLMLVRRPKQFES